MGGLFEGLSGDGVFTAMSIVQQADETEQQLVARAIASVSGSAWEVGQCACLWTQRHAAGRTDEDFANLIGLSRDQVAKRRLVYEEFADVCDSNHKLCWTHYDVARTWRDASECLAWAEENAATVAEMKAFHRMQAGEDLTTEADSPETDDASGGQTEHEAPESQPGGPSTFRPDAGGEAPERHVRPAKAKATAAPKAAVTPPESSWTLSELQALLTGAEDASDSGQRKKLAAWHLKRAEQLAPKRKSAVFRKPTVDEVSEYVRNAGSNVDPQQFVDFYESKGWKVGATAMRDWKAACRNWSRRESGTGKRSILDGLKRFADGGEG